MFGFRKRRRTPELKAPLVVPAVKAVPAPVAGSTVNLSLDPAASSGGKSSPVPRRVGVVGWIAITGGLIAVGCLALDVLCGQDQDDEPMPVVYARVKLSGVPAWMPRDVAQGVLASLQKKAQGRAIDDEALAEDVHRAAAANPWVADVREVATFEDGSVLVRAEYRRPFALVASARLGPGDLRVVDAEAVVLPISPARVNARSFVLIRDVAAPPPAPGRRWDAPDLTDGLRLLRMVKDRPYVKDITAIDVRNHAGVITGEPELRLRAESDQGAVTDIRFGRFPAPDGLDVCLTPERRLEYLDAYARSNGGRVVGANAFVELRYDQLYVSPR